MPLYEYVCGKCGHRFEVIQKFSDPPVEECPKCGGRVEKVQSAPAIQFKGTGWYITDYAKKDSVPAESAKSDAKPESKSASESKTEAKSDSAPAKSDKPSTSTSK